MNRYENDDRRDDDATFGEQAGRFSRKLSDSAQQVWLAGLGALGRAQAEGSRFFDGLVKEGEAWEARRRERASEQGPGWRDNVESSLDEAREKASGTWNKVEKAFDDQVQGVLKRLHVPTADELTALEARLDALHARLAKLETRAASGSDAPAPGSHQSPGSVP
ncbi:phasin family protein [Stenotrophomonas sp. TWI143]|jgi:poly(hydroxyalkanoate) granule-associated protein|uniref:Poly(Hydroxyalkanoate) granule-associated protein n=2 Tax=Gammaproteobacteria TaxID=1236 RepID=A0AAP7KZC5_STEMA|nr:MULTISPECIES: phasin family protein [Stenotrophomonas]KOQ71672.1 poly(hydroxyalkanoate) granule-associated protein [Stenotrophomonas maltophilia]MBE5271599.1 phasin family protein [Stenotrophomonas sp. B2]MBH1664682.1 phasin family protein [Stenotrophomonas maltophilia]MBH1837229.1 phasin family protein [Stenotrophomonas maltophilia]MBN4936934.1 phasin family protein [Stenotrophomonas maltophilia]